MCAVAALSMGALTGGCAKKKEAVYTIGPENVPDLEKGEQEVKGEKAVNPLEATKENASGSEEGPQESGKK
jgi:hypothetical protein